MVRLLGLTEDVLVHLVSFLQPPDILSLAKTCKSFRDLASLHIIWTNARNYHVIENGYPTLSIPSQRLSTTDLIKHTRQAFGLGERWLAGISTPRKTRSISGTSGASVSDVRFVPGFNQGLLLTISRSIWSAVSIWDMSVEAPRKVCEWSPRGAIFSGFTLNVETESEATIAISLRINDGDAVVKILSLEEVEGHFVFHEIYSVEVDMEPITLSGDLLALADDLSQTAIWNWRLGTYALLDSAPLNTDGDQGAPQEAPVVLTRISQYDHCLQVIFAHQSILVVRARTIHLFPHPILQAPAHSHTTEPDQHLPSPSCSSLAHHSFGWVDSVSVTQCPHLQGAQSHPWPSLSILVRGECDDPWDSDLYNLGLYTLDPNPDYASFPYPCSPSSSSPANPSTLPNPHLPPYIFPPRLAHKIPSPHGSLRCTQVILGRLGTAVWVQPRDRFGLGLLADMFVAVGAISKKSNEGVMMGVFPGSLTVKAKAKAEAVVWFGSEGRDLGGRGDGGGDSESGDQDQGEGEEEGEVVGVMGGRKVWVNENNDCASLDYDEELGRVVLGTSSGKIWIFEL